MTGLAYEITIGKRVPHHRCRHESKCRPTIGWPVGRPRTLALILRMDECDATVSAHLYVDNVLSFVFRSFCYASPVLSLEIDSKQNDTLRSVLSARTDTNANTSKNNQMLSLARPVYKWHRSRIECDTMQTTHQATIHLQNKWMCVRCSVYATGPDRHRTVNGICQIHSITIIIVIRYFLCVCVCCFFLYLGSVRFFVSLFLCWLQCATSARWPTAHRSIIVSPLFLLLSYRFPLFTVYVNGNNTSRVTYQSRRCSYTAHTHTQKHVEKKWMFSGKIRGRRKSIPRRIRMGKG